MGSRPDINGRELLIEAALKLFAEEGIDGGVDSRGEP